MRDLVDFSFHVVKRTPLSEAVDSVGPTHSGCPLIWHVFQASGTSSGTAWTYVEPNLGLRFRSISRHVEYMLVEEILERMNSFIHSSSNLTEFLSW